MRAVVSISGARRFYHAASNVFDTRAIHARATGAGIFN